MSESSLPPARNDGSESVRPEDGQAEPTGFDILFQGLELVASGDKAVTSLSPAQPLSCLAGLDILCSVTRNDTFEYGLDNVLDSRLDLGMLCAITAADYNDQLTWVDPILKLKSELTCQNIGPRI